MGKIPNSKAGGTVVTKEFSDMLWKQLREKGYDNISDFARQSGLVKKEYSLVAFETIRRAFAVGERMPAMVSLAVIMLNLDFPRSFVRDYLQDQGDVLLRYLMGPGEAPQLRIWEEGLLEAANAIAEKNADAIVDLGKQVQMLALSEGLDVTDSVSKMGYRSERIRKRGPES